MENKEQKTAVVFGAGGFIGSHLVTRLRKDGYYVIGVDLKYPEFSDSNAHKFYKYDLRDISRYDEIIPENCDALFQLAADMGGATFVFTGVNDSEIMHNSAMINLHTCHWCVKKKVKKVFYSSSACCYNEENQLDANNPICTEESAYPANPDSEYGWEKLFSERLYLAYKRNHGLDVKIARYHNVTGPEGTWTGGREKAPAAICRKVAMAQDGGTVEIFGDGKQTRSFLLVDTCVEGTMRLMDSDFSGPVNIGSDESVTINHLTEMVIGISGKKLSIKHIDGPLGVRGRTSDNTLIKEKLNWEPDCPLIKTMSILYPWVKSQVYSV
jgi:nucleoside-diphosphate-sugar epimerase